MTTPVTIRHAVRILLLDESNRVLLFETSHPDTGLVFWITPGGGVEAGEDARAAIERELSEETGLRDVPPHTEVWHRRHTFTWRGERYDQRERWFLIPVARFDPDWSGLTDEERVELTAWRWWTLDELDRATDALSPRDLAVHLRALIVDGPPPAPLDVGL